MNFNEEDIRSDVGFVCIGQAAGNIGLLFEEKGYNVLYINTSSEDLALLKNASFAVKILRFYCFSNERFCGKGCYRRVSST